MHHKAQGLSGSAATGVHSFNIWLTEGRQGMGTGPVPGFAEKGSYRINMKQCKP